MAEFDHNKLLADAARDALSPLGFRRKGRSRVWYQDNGWWLSIVEFQASSYSRGSYLEVAPMWFWRPSGPYFAPDFMGRIGGFRPVVDENEFVATSNGLAHLAADASQRISGEITSPATAAAFIQASSVARHPDLNAGVARGLAHDWDEADRLLRAFRSRAESFDEPGPLVPWADRLIDLLREPGFDEAVRSCVEQRRSELKLEPRDISF